jgi:hypothetical protein
MEFLGVLVNTTDMLKFHVPLSKAHALHHDIKRLLHLHDREGKVPVHRLAAVVGQGVAMTKVVLLGKLLLCNVHCVIATWKSWNDQVQLLTAVVEDLEEWLHGLLLWDGNLTHLCPHDVLIDTDASLTGWGPSLMATGWWWRQDMHINEYKMHTVLKALRTFSPHLTGKSILMQCDNVMMVAHINNMGGWCQRANLVMWKIVVVCHDNNLGAQLSPPTP